MGYRYCKVRVNACGSQGIVVIITDCKDLLSTSINTVWYYCVRVCVNYIVLPVLIHTLYSTFVR